MIAAALAAALYFGGSSLHDVAGTTAQPPRSQTLLGPLGPDGESTAQGSTRDKSAVLSGVDSQLTSTPTASPTAVDVTLADTGAPEATETPKATETPEATASSETDTADSLEEATDTPTPTEVPPTETPVPPTETPDPPTPTEVPPTETPVPPTPTPVPPTATPVPPTATPVPPTATPKPPTPTATKRAAAPTKTPVPTATQPASLVGDGTVIGTASFYADSLAGSPMGCDGTPYNPNNPYIVAIGPSHYDEWPCFTSIDICGPVTCITALRTDSCPGCGSSQIDVSHSGYTTICGNITGPCPVTFKRTR
ncbi:MAG TPA: RlpA-like double-psi beta-barrel domain-containing protein [Dehalococcoidia bacterium]|nr:RlpA-like double-psi beta-barrel domain-containing protein [Dehalococcoidia bacterium]